MREIDLISIGERYAAFRQLSLARIGVLSAKDGKFFSRLKAGKTCTLRTARNVDQWFSDHWPSDLEWPADIHRPPVTPPEPEETPAGDEAAPAGVDKQVEEPVA